MISKDRLDIYFVEANKHIIIIQEALAELEVPIKNYDNLPKLQKFALNTLIFRFSKLQDLIGVKIFRNYLEFSGFNIVGISFFDLLKEIEKEKIVDIDSWMELRELRNKIAHDYPNELDEILDSINLLIKKCAKLIDISKRLEVNFHEIKKQRG